MVSLKKLQHKINSLTLIFIFLGFLGVINYFSTKLFFRLDLTENKEFTISKSTKEVLKNLDDLVNINLYFSKKLPPYLVNLTQKVDDLLKEYQIYSKGKIKFNYLDPSKDLKLTQSAQLMGIPQVQFNIIEKDKAQVVNIYLGIAILYEDKKEVIPLVKDTDNLEYELTSKILKLTSPQIKTIGFLTGHQEHSIYQDYNEIRNLLEKQYKTCEVKVENNKTKINVNTLIIPGPKEKIPEETALKINQFIMEGGKVVFLLDAIKIAEDSLNVTLNNDGLDFLLKNYGVRLNKNLILDRSYALASFSSGFAYFTLPYPLWIKILAENTALNHPIINKLGSLVFPWSASVEILPSLDKKIKAVELVKTTKHAWIQEESFNLNPQQSFISPKTSQSTLALMLKGRFKSALKEKDNIIKESSPEAQIVLIGNSNLITDNFIRQFNFNSIFFLNIIDWLNLGDKLIDIRLKEVIDRPLKEISEYNKSLFKFIVMFLAPLGVIIYSGIRFYLKNKTKKLLEVYEK
ncbi:GldG family protein [bacterium]|nr:GldG family protein [bacterium]